MWTLRWPLQNVVLLAALPPLYLLSGIPGAIGSMSVAAGVVLLVGAASIAGRVAPPPVPLPPGIVRFGVLQAASSVFSQARQRGGVLAVAVLGSSTAEVGFAALAINIGLAATYAIGQIFSVELPRLAREPGARAGGDFASAQSLSLRLTSVVVPVTVFCALVLDEVVPLLAGEDFEAGVDALVPALAVIPLAPLTSLANQVGALRLRSAIRLWANVAGTLVFALVAAVAVPAWGAAGGSAAFLAGSAATACVGALALRDAVGLRRLGVALGGSAAVVVAGLLA